MDTVRKDGTFGSTTGLADINYRCWAPADPEQIKAVFQIAHGMAEHIERYELFAQHLCSQGYAVYANDHIGHGKSVKTDDDLGYFGERDGWMAFVNDCKLLSDIARGENPGKPLIFFGHSMGSFIARKYAEKFGTEIAGAVFCGTSGNNPAAGVGSALAGVIAALKGARHRSDFLNKMSFGSYNKRIPNPRTDFDWLSRDKAIVDAYIEDKYCGFLFTAVGYRDLATLLHNVSSKAWYNNLPYALPILVVSGSMDPVGEYGKGIRQFVEDLKRSGHRNVTVKLYDGDRHEILNELDKQTVFDDITKWADKMIAASK